jgi:hypothetical protein
MSQPFPFPSFLLNYSRVVALGAVRLMKATRVCLQNTSAHRLAKSLLWQSGRWTYKRFTNRCQIAGLSPRTVQGAHWVLNAPSAAFTLDVYSHVLPATCRMMMRRKSRRHCLGRKRWKLQIVLFERLTRRLESLRELYDRYAQNVANANQI